MDLTSNSILKIHQHDTDATNNKLQDNTEYKQPDGVTDVKLLHKYTGTCPAGFATNHINCPLPEVRAYDKKDAEITDRIQTRLYHIEDDQGSVVSQRKTAIDFAQRGKWRIEYVCKDKAGNYANSLRYDLILDDRVAPRVNLCNGEFEVVESNATWQLCGSGQYTQAYDNIDGDQSTDVKYVYKQTKGKCCGSPASAPYCQFNEACPGASWSSPKTLYELRTDLEGSENSNYGEYEIKGFVRDDANHFGATSEDVCYNLTTNGQISPNQWPLPTSTATCSGCRCGNLGVGNKIVQIKDTLPPWITMNGFEPERYECKRNNYNGKKAEGSTLNYLDPSDTRCTDNTMVSTPNTEHWCEYKDAHAFANDHGDDNLNRAIYVVNNSNVISSKPGTYTVRYNAQDSHFNPAIEVNRTVYVQDTTLCELKFNGSAVIEHYANESRLCLKQGAPYKRSLNTELSMQGANHQTQAYCNLNPGMCVPCEDEIFESNDECEFLSQDNLTLPTWSRTFDDQIVGHYVKTYHCDDTHGNSNYLTRTYIVQDKQKPIIDIEGDEDLTLEAKGPGNIEYTDDGATCTDYVDGDISHAVEVSGQIVNMHVPGTYLIDYECTDLSGNTAEMKRRTVTIVDNDCPVISLLGAQTTHVEAGFDYLDKGATATDDLDGDLTDFVWTSGDTVDVREFAKLHDCGQIHYAWNQRTSGHHKLMQGSHAAGSGTYSASTNSSTDTAMNDGDFLVTIGGQRRKVYCDFGDTPADAKTYGLITNGTDISMANNGNCQARGFDGKARSSLAENWGGSDCDTEWGTRSGVSDSCVIGTADELDRLETLLVDDSSDLTPADFADVAAIEEYVAKINSSYADLQAESTKNELCFKKHQANPFWTDSNTPNTYAAQGYYKVHYHVKDRAGNPECTPVKRTVIVTDSLPPVITLHLKNSNSRYNSQDSNPYPKLIARGSHDASSKQTNPAARSKQEYLDNAALADYTAHPGWNPNIKDQHDDVIKNGQTIPMYNSEFPHDTSYMAQASSSNGLAIAAVVFAASGVAFIAFAAVSKRQAATIDV